MNTQNKSWLEKWEEYNQNDQTYLFESIMFDTSETIAGYMEDHNITRTELAKRMGCSKAYITKLLRGSSNYTVETLIKLSFALGMTLKVELLDETKEAGTGGKKKAKYDHKQPVKKVAEG